jgi:ABC-type transport system involved in cytochrome c biogenesis permease component
MKWLRVARAISGVLSILLLSSLLLLETLYKVSVQSGRIDMLVLLIGALLGVDIVFEHIPISGTVEFNNTTDDEDS